MTTVYETEIYQKSFAKFVASGCSDAWAHQQATDIANTTYSIAASKLRGYSSNYSTSYSNGYPSGYSSSRSYSFDMGGSRDAPPRRSTYQVRTEYSNYGKAPASGGDKPYHHDPPPLGRAQTYQATPREPERHVRESGHRKHRTKESSKGKEKGYFDEPETRPEKPSAGHSHSSRADVHNKEYRKEPSKVEEKDYHYGNRKAQPEKSSTGRSRSSREDYFSPVEAPPKESRGREGSKRKDSYEDRSPRSKKPSTSRSNSSREDDYPADATPSREHRPRARSRGRENDRYERRARPSGRSPSRSYSSRVEEELDREWQKTTRMRDDDLRRKEQEKKDPYAGLPGKDHFKQSTTSRNVREVRPGDSLPAEQKGPIRDAPLNDKFDDYLRENLKRERQTEYHTRTEAPGASGASYQDAGAGDTGYRSQAPLTHPCPNLDPYATLGVDKEATPDQIKSAFRKLSLKNHPDRAAGDGRDAANERMTLINQAHDVLKDEAKRRRYDMFRKAEEARRAEMSGAM